MLTGKRIRKDFGDNICRKCINRHYGVQLKQEDCVYGYYYRCRSCRETQNIVVDLTPSGKLKTILK